MNEHTIKVARWEEDDVPHIKIEAEGEDAEHLGRTIDDILSRTEEPPGRPLIEVLGDDE